MAQATAIDLDGFVGTARQVIKVRDPADQAAPSVELQLAEGNTIVRDVLDIVGSVSDSNLDHYRLQLVSPATGQTVLLAEGVTPTSDAVLGRIDPWRLSNGPYDVELLATDIAGRQSDTRRTIEIRTSDKTADFVTSASDFALELDGVALNFQRSYSSLDASMAGLLGYGWKLDAAEPRLALVLAQNEPAGAALPPALHAGGACLSICPMGSACHSRFNRFRCRWAIACCFDQPGVVPTTSGTAWKVPTPCSSRFRIGSIRSVLDCRTIRPRISPQASTTRW